MFEDNQDLIQEFVIESREGLAEIETDLLAIEAGGATIDLELVNKVFRAIHTIKGAAGFLGLATIGELSHNLEGVLSQIRNQTLVPTRNRVSVLLRSADMLRSLIEDIANSDRVDISACVAELALVASGVDDSDSGSIAVHDHDGAPPMNSVETAAPELPRPGATTSASPINPKDSRDYPVCSLADLPIALTTEDLHRLQSKDQFIYLMTFDLIGDSEYADNIIDWSQRLGDTGEVLGGTIDRHQLPCLEDALPDSLPCQVVLASVLKPETFINFWRLPPERIQVLELSSSGCAPEKAAPVAGPATSETAVRTAPDSHPGPGPGPSSASAATIVQSSASDDAVQANASAPPAATATPSGPAGSESVPRSEPPRTDLNIRVPVSLLDRLMNLAGELVLSRNQLLQTIPTHDPRLLESVSARIDLVTSELQDAIMQTRMQPIGNIFSRFTRVVRDLSNTLGRKCQLLIEGQDVELDKTIIEAIGDPLTHLVRNSVDHGIEKPDVRTRNGKPETGTIHLRAWHQEGKVHLEIADDGAGIDAAKLRRKVVEKNLMPAEKAEALSDAEAVRLIFLPGFSTADQVSAVSGRGVGMDVVKTNFEKLGGTVDIQTEVGRGTRITVRLPLTLAIMPSLIVAAGKQRFAIPQANICELVRLRAGDTTRRIETLKNAEVLRLRGTLLPLVRLNRVLSTSPVTASADATDSAHSTSIVVVESAGRRYGLVVDHLHDSEEIVVKPLGRHMRSVQVLAGATVLGDGQVALILDIAGVASQAELTQTAESTASTETHSEQTETISTLLFTSHPSELFGIPMSCVTRIERITSDQIDAIAGQELLQYRGASLPLLAIDKCLNARPRPQQTRLFVIVFRAGHREVGLIATSILDIRDIPHSLDTTTFTEPGVLGSLILDQQTIRIVDAWELARKQHPEWFETLAPHGARSRHETAEATPAMKAHRESPVVLLAEDSAFFRTRVAGFLEQLGLTVVTAENGQEAWQLLQSGEHHFSLIVTDIEMPVLNGFELCQRIRAEQRWNELPVLALTSLASDEFVARGHSVGFNEYLIKLDRERLILAVTALLSARAIQPRTSNGRKRQPDPAM